LTAGTGRGAVCSGVSKKVSLSRQAGQVPSWVGAPRPAGTQNRLCNIVVALPRELSSPFGRRVWSGDLRRRPSSPVLTPDDLITGEHDAWLPCAIRLADRHRAEVLRR